MLKFLSFFTILLCSGQMVSGQVIPLYERFDFLKGSWSFKTEKGSISEIWKLNDKSELHGLSYSIKHSGDSTLLETIKLIEANGDIFYIPTGYGPGNNSTVVFKLISSADSTFVFENAGHDFPQRIVYRHQSDNEILAWIEGSLNGKYRKVEFPYRREKKE